MEPNLKHGDILVCRRDSILSNIIRKATKSEWSHTAIVIEIWRKLYIVDMQRKGVELNTVEDWNNKWNYDYVIYRNKNIGLVHAGIAKRAIRKVGRKVKYDKFTFLFRVPWKLKTGRYKYRGEEIETKRMICSQLTGWIWNMTNWWEMTPDDQVKYMDKSVEWSRG